MRATELSGSCARKSTTSPEKTTISASGLKFVSIGFAERNKGNSLISHTCCSKFVMLSQFYRTYRAGQLSIDAQLHCFGQPRGLLCVRIVSRPGKSVGKRWHTFLRSVTHFRIEYLPLPPENLIIDFGLGEEVPKVVPTARVCWMPASRRRRDGAQKIMRPKVVHTLRSTCRVETFQPGHIITAGCPTPSKETGWHRCSTDDVGITVGAFDSRIRAQLPVSLSIQIISPRGHNCKDINSRVEYHGRNKAC